MRLWKLGSFVLFFSCVVGLSAQTPSADFTTTLIEEGPNFKIVQFLPVYTGADNYLWDFGDGSVSSEMTPIHRFSSVKKHYRVKLTVWNDGEEPIEEEKSNVVEVVKPSSANFEGYEIVGPPGLEVVFTNLTGGSAQFHEWTYGDGEKEIFRHGTKPNERINPIHVFRKDGVYDIKLRSYGQGGESSLLIPGMIYVDSQFRYRRLKLLESGATYPGNSWNNLIDHKVHGSTGKVAAKADDAWALYTFTDGKIHTLAKFRFLADDVLPNKWATNIVNEYEFWVSTDNVNFELAYSGHSTGKNGKWEIVEFTQPTFAKFIKIKLVSARSQNARYIELFELQVFTNDPIRFEKEAQDNDESLLQESYQLNQNYPNPFNPHTTIDFFLAEDAEIELNIFNLQGKCVRELASGHYSFGRHSVIWDSTDSFGSKVASGAYLYALRVNDGQNQQLLHKQMVLLK